MSDKIAFIGGSGIYNLGFLKNKNNVRVSTPYGLVEIIKSDISNKQVFFMPRHGSRHTLLPSMVNYRANIAALKILGIKKIIAAAAVGSLRREMPPGSMVILDQFIDQTRGRITTFYSGEGHPVIHTDFTEPYCPGLRKLLITECVKSGNNFSSTGTYVTTDGPRFETPAEIRAFARMGGDLVGMTNVPEVTLAREAGLCYATVGLVTNYAAGISPNVLTHEEVLEAMEEHGKKVNELFLACINGLPEEHDCNCAISGKHFKVEGTIEEDD